MAEKHSVIRLPVRQLYSETCRWNPRKSSGGFGSGRELALSELIAVKPPLKFRFLEAAIRH